MQLHFDIEHRSKSKKSSADDKENKPDETINNTTQATQNMAVQETQAGSGSPDKSLADDKGANKPTVAINQYRAFFRELDLEVFSILGCGLLSRTVLDSNMHTKVWL